MASVAATSPTAGEVLALMRRFAYHPSRMLTYFWVVEMHVFELDALLWELTPHQLKLVQALYDSEGKWLTRAEVARAISKKRLTPYDINCLDMLTEKGLIETSTKPTTAPGSDFAYIYNMSDTMAQLIAHWDEMRERGQLPQRRKPVNLVNE